MTMAPNLVTLIGFIAILYQYFQTIYYCSNFEGYAPKWVFLMNAACIWWYQTLDAIDGKQARRTKNGSPLGELFDHGCDSLSSFLTAGSLVCALQLGGSMYSYCVILGVHTIFFFSIWEQYYTNILRFSKFTGPTEALILLIIVHIITGIFGVSFWRMDIAYGYKLGELLGFFFIFSIIPSLYENITCIMKYEISENDKKIKGNPFIITIPYFIITISWSIWVFAGKDNLFALYPVITSAIYGLVIGFTITMMVISRVCNQKTKMFYLIMIPLPILAFISYFRITIPIQIGYVLFLVLECVLVFYMDMIFRVINILCGVLKIRCFVLKPVINN